MADEGVDGIVGELLAQVFEFGNSTGGVDLAVDSVLLAVGLRRLRVGIDGLLVVLCGSTTVVGECRDVTKKDVNNVLPFGNTVYLVYVKGSVILEALEASTFCTPSSIGAFPQVAGMEMTIDTTKKYDAKSEAYPNST